MKKLVGFILFVVVIILGWQGAFSAEASIFAYSIEQPQLTHMNALIEETELAELVDKHGPFTLVAPSDAAFEAVAERIATLDTTQKRQLVLYHIVHGEVSSADLADFTLLGTALGQPIRIVRDDDIALLNGKTTFVANEHIGANGVLHVVDAVLFPDDTVISSPPAAVPEPEPTSEKPLTSNELFFDYEGPRAAPRVWFELGHIDEPVGIGPAARSWDSAEFAISVNTIYAAVRATQKLLPQLNGGTTTACEAYFDNYLLVALAPKFSAIPNSEATNVAQYETAVGTFLDRNRPHVHYCLNRGTFSQFNYSLAWIGVNEALPILNGLRQTVGIIDQQETLTLMQTALSTFISHSHIPLKVQP